MAALKAAGCEKIHAEKRSGAELHLALEHSNDLLICVTVRLDMDATPIAVSSLHAAALCAAVSQARAEFSGLRFDERKLSLRASFIMICNPHAGGERSPL